MYPMMRPMMRWAIGVVIAVASCGAPQTRSDVSGRASWYGTGKRTASGERFDKWGLTAAHRTLPFGTRVRVTNLKNGKTVVVRINDRGPFIHGRIIDLSQGAAQQIGMIKAGVVPVTLEVLR